jgi:hypothetical protein
MEFNRGNEEASFSKAIRRHPLREDVYWRRTRSYIDRGFYGKQLQRLQRLFPPANILLLNSHEFAADPRRIFDSVCKFLLLAPLVDLSVQYKHIRVKRDYGCLPEYSDLLYCKEVLFDDFESFASSSQLRVDDWPMRTGNISYIRNRYRI